MSTIYVCDWCGDEFHERENVASADVTIGTVNRKYHLCVGCAPDDLESAFPN